MKQLIIEQFKVVLRFLKDEINKEKNIDEKWLDIKQWHIDMTKPLDKTIIKYSKAVQRITNKIPVYYTACQYRDKHVITTNSFLNELDAYNILSKMEDVSHIWDIVDEANRLCASYHDYVIIVAPTREQLDENIKKNKQKKMDNSSVCDSFYTSLRELYGLSLIHI